MKRTWRRSRKPFAQKPWNKVPRIQKFWTSNRSPENDPAQAVIVGGTGPYTTNASVVVGLFGDQLASDPTSGVSLRSQEHVKIHRLQGHLWCWLTPMSNAGEVAFWNDGSPGGTQDYPGNVALLNYVWLKVKAIADSPGIVGLANVQGPDSFNPNITQDWQGLAARDDLLRFGTLPVFGAVPRMLTKLQDNVVAGTATTPTQAHADYQGTVMGNAGQYLQGHLAKIPLPRIGKMGLNLRKGEALLCIGSVMAGGPCSPDSDSLDDATVRRGVVVYNDIRALCSI